MERPSLAHQTGLTAAITNVASLELCAKYFVIVRYFHIFSHIRPTHLTAASEKIFHFTSKLADTASSVPLTNLTILFCIFPRSVFKLFNLITHSRRSIISTSCWRKGKSRILALMIKAEECLFLTPYFPTTLI